MPIFPDCSFGVPARMLAAILVLGTASTGPALAQAPASPAAPGSAAPGSAAPKPAAPETTTPGSAAPGAAKPDPVLATVNGDPIHLGDLNAAAETLPAQARALPPQQLYPMLLEQLIDGRALLVEAQKTGVANDPAVQRQVQAAQDRALESALLNKVIRPQVTDEAVKARYDEQMAGKTGDEEVHARHILVGDEATAKKIIAELKKGGDFAALSKQVQQGSGGGSAGWRSGLLQEDRHGAGIRQRGVCPEGWGGVADAGAHSVRLARDPGARPSHNTVAQF